MKNKTNCNKFTYLFKICLKLNLGYKKLLTTIKLLLNFKSLY